MRSYIFICLMLFVSSCTDNTSQTEKYQNNRNKVIDVQNAVKEINTGNVLISSSARLYITDGYLLIADSKGYDKLIHLFDNSDYNHVVSTGTLGQGNNEIANLGSIGIDNRHKKFYVSDHGKMRIYSYDIDSLLNMPESYESKVKVRINNSMFPSEYCYVDDTLSYARVIKPTSASTFEQSVAKWNMQTGEIDVMEYSHPDVKNKRSIFDVSLQHGIYVEGYLRHDLLSICDLEGALVCNIYGPDWNGGGKSNMSGYGDVMITSDNIIATYSGGDYNEAYNPTKLHVFDIKGNYQKTLDVKFKIVDCCYDPKQNRVVMAFDDEIQFGYLDLDNVL